MALVTCDSCRGVGKVFGMGYVHRKCAKCEGCGEVSDVVSVGGEPVKVRVKRSTKDMNPVVTLETLAEV